MKRIPLDLAPSRAKTQTVAQSVYEHEERRYWARHERLRRQRLSRRDEERAWRYDGPDDIEDSGDIQEENENE